MIACILPENSPIKSVLDKIDFIKKGVMIDIIIEGIKNNIILENNEPNLTSKPTKNGFIVEESLGINAIKRAEINNIKNKTSGTSRFSEILPPNIFPMDADNKIIPIIAVHTAVDVPKYGDITRDATNSSNISSAFNIKNNIKQYLV